MRDPDRIPVVLEGLRRVWVENPDLRLGQIIVNALRPNEDNLFNVEDDVLMDAIDADRV